MLKAVVAVMSDNPKPYHSQPKKGLRNLFSGLNMYKSISNYCHRNNLKKWTPRKKKKNKKPAAARLIAKVDEERLNLKVKRVRAEKIKQSHRELKEIRKWIEIVKGVFSRRCPACGSYHVAKHQHETKFAIHLSYDCLDCKSLVKRLPRKYKRNIRL